MNESRWKRPSALLPLTLAVSMFAVGAAGYVAMAGVPEFSHPVISLSEVALALPATDPAAAMVSRSHATAEAAAVDDAATPSEVATSVDILESPGSASVPSVTAASTGSTVQVLPAPAVVPPVITAVAVVPPVTTALALAASAVPVLPTATVAVSAAKSADPTPAPGARLATLVTATPSPMWPVESTSSGKNGHGAPAPIKRKLDDATQPLIDKERRDSPDRR